VARGLAGVDLVASVTINIVPALTAVARAAENARYAPRESRPQVVTPGPE